MLKNRQSILCAANVGGHLTELLIIAESLGIDGQAFFITDQGNANAFLKRSFFVKRTGKIQNLPINIVLVIRVLLKVKPSFVISTGAELGLLTGILAKIMLGSRVIYVECSAQVRRPSISGRLIYPFADLFFVQWKPLLKSYGRKAKYRGNLIFGDVD